MTDIVDKIRFDATGVEFVPISLEDAGMTAIEGDPQPRVCTLVATEHVWIGLSKVEPSVQKLKVNNHSVLTFIEGEGTLTVDGKSREIVAGDSVVFQPGVEAHWELRTPLRDWFVMYGPFES
ncbi:DUF861 domain-containing protein [Streptomyces antnestii]|uniref:DUF861 domain-containing protein n=1 Tax=Streptomyces antnestii TaxID=2494256 RepID=A0A437Q3A8_9ACTN|nr:cupin domain-containing protein [Streptomyces sp. San01]RVU29017.1 DUF861 domain-containing protein [Streptomyces sp. San01]